MDTLTQPTPSHTPSSALKPDRLLGPWEDCGVKWTIIPYLRGMWPSSAFYLLWCAMKHDKVLGRIFYTQRVKRPAERGDLHHLYTYMTEATVFFLYADEQVVGCVWFTDLTDYQGSIGVYYRQDVPSDIKDTVTSKVCAFCFEVYGWRQIWGFTPWRNALRHAQRCGFSHHATFPEYCKIGEKFLPLYIARGQNPCLQPPESSGQKIT